MGKSACRGAGMGGGARRERDVSQYAWVRLEDRLYSLAVTPHPALISRLQTSVGNVMGVGLGPNRSLDSPSGSGSERPLLPNPARMMFGRSNPGRKPHGSSQKV